MFFVEHPLHFLVNNELLILGLWILAVGWNWTNRLQFVSQTCRATLPWGTKQYWCCINMDKWSYIRVQRHPVLASKPAPPSSGEGLSSKHRHTLDAVWRLSHQRPPGIQHKPYVAQWFSIVTVRDAYLLGSWQTIRKCSHTRSVLFSLDNFCMKTATELIFEWCDNGIII